MTLEELDAWAEFHAISPIDDVSLVYKPASILAAVGHRAGKQPDFYLDMMLPKQHDYSDVDASIFKAFGITPPR